MRSGMSRGKLIGVRAHSVWVRRDPARGKGRVRMYLPNLLHDSMRFCVGPGLARYQTGPGSASVGQNRIAHKAMRLGVILSGNTGVQ